MLIISLTDEKKFAGSQLTISIFIACQAQRDVKQGHAIEVEAKALASRLKPRPTFRFRNKSGLNILTSVVNWHLVMF